MRTAVLTIDQRGSTRGSDRVPATLAGLADVAMLRPFERTAGDEFQGVLDDPAAVTTVVERLLREDGWSVGIGIGEVEEPLPESTRAGRGPAYLAARDAVTAAKSAPWRLRVAGDGQGVRALETTLWLWAAVLNRRTPRGWEVADLVDTGASYEEVGQAARRHPVRDQPARPGGRHRRGAAGPRAGHPARRWPAAGSAVMTTPRNRESGALRAETSRFRGDPGKA